MGGILPNYSAKSPCALPSCWAGLHWVESAFSPALGILSGCLLTQFHLTPCKRNPCSLVCDASLRGGRPLSPVLVFFGSHLQNTKHFRGGKRIVTHHCIKKANVLGTLLPSWQHLLRVTCILFFNSNCKPPSGTESIDVLTHRWGQSAGHRDDNAQNHTAKLGCMELFTQ